MAKVIHGQGNGVKTLECQLEDLAGYSPETVIVHDVDYDPFTGAKGLVLISFGKDFSDGRVDVADKVAELGAGLITAMNRLKAEKEAEEDDSCLFCFGSNSEQEKSDEGPSEEAMKKLCEGLCRALGELRDDEKDSECSNCPFCSCPDNEAAEEQAGDALKEIIRLLKELKKASMQ